MADNTESSLNPHILLHHITGQQKDTRITAKTTSTTGSSVCARIPLRHGTVDNMRLSIYVSPVHENQDVSKFSLGPILHGLTWPAAQTLLLPNTETRQRTRNKEWCKLKADIQRKRHVSSLCVCVNSLTDYIKLQLWLGHFSEWKIWAVAKKKNPK